MRTETTIKVLDSKLDDSLQFVEDTTVSLTEIMIHHPDFRDGFIKVGRHDLRAAVERVVK